MIWHTKSVACSPTCTPSPAGVSTPSPSVTVSPSVTYSEEARDILLEFLEYCKENYPEAVFAFNMEKGENL